MAYTLVLHDPSVVALKTIYCAGLTGMLALWVDQRATDRAGVGAGSSPTRTNEETKKGVPGSTWSVAEGLTSFFRSLCGDEKGPLVAQDGRLANMDQFRLLAH